MLVQQILKTKSDDGVVTVTPGTSLAKAAEILSTSFWMGARLAWAAETSAATRASTTAGGSSAPASGGTLKNGLMGEAGPEATMPLARGADGRLGVQAASGGRAVTVVMNITTPDVQGFQRSQSQIAAQAQRMLARGQKNR